jgi:hypothetical protein
MNKKTIAIINYNTPELTEAAIKSIRKHGGEDYRVVIFDNSNARPFTKKMRGVEVIDNTNGQVINFDEELEKFPNRVPKIGCAKGCEYGSAKHMMTVQKLWELLPDGFVLMESDILLKANIDEFFRPEYSVVGYCQKAQPHNPFSIGRMLPMLCWMNVPLLTKYGTLYFDPKRTYGLLAGGKANRNNWYDTGAPLLADILAKRPHLKGLHIDIRNYVEHYGSGSWKNNDQSTQIAWLEAHRNLWDIPQPKGVAVCAIGRMENRYAVEWVEHYLKIGIDKIFIYDNNRPEDGETFADVLQAYIDNGSVEIIPWEGLQKPAYEDCYNKHNGEYDWIGFFDFDEFLEIDDHKTAKELLAPFHYADVLVMNWREMTDSNLVHYDARPVKERFTIAAPTECDINHHVKCFVHNGINGISFNDPHCPNAPQLRVVNVMGEEVEQKPLQPSIIHAFARIDHYDTKTAEEWVNIKQRRGTCSGDEITRQKRAVNVEYFFSLNERTPEKEHILGVRTANEETAKKPAKKSKPKTAKKAVSKE